MNLPFDIGTLLVFGKVVECRSLSKAAHLLGMPKSTVSRRISKLEADLGIKLLRKNTHQVTFTDLGEQIYKHGLNILAEVNDVRSLVEGSKREPQGMLKVALPVFMGIDYASTVAATFLERYPKARLELRLVDSVVHPVNDGFDVALGIGPLQDSTLIARKVFALESFLCASPAFLRALPAPLRHAADLAKVPFIDSGLYADPAKLRLTRAKQSCEVALLVRARANNFQVSKRLIMQGLGVGAMPEKILCSGELREGSIVPVLPEWELPAIDVYMIFPFQLSFSNLVGAFHEIALEVVSSNIARSAAQAAR